MKSQAQLELNKNMSYLRLMKSRNFSLFFVENHLDFHRKEQFNSSNDDG